MKKRKTTEQFIEEAKKIHEDKYDYSKVVYINNKTKVCIICPEHGEFWQTPDRHLHSGGCFKCGSKKRGLKRRINFDDFVKKSDIVHNKKYTYCRETFTKTSTKTKIICPIHGEFWQTPDSHLHGHGCPCCKKEKLAKLRQEEFGDFTSNAKKIHGDKYDYSMSNYVSSVIPIKIICKTHGEFFQRPTVHLRGCGCPKCNESHLEKSISEFLSKKNIESVSQKKFDWLLYEKNMFLDFYLPQYNVAIECQGEQHIYETKISSGIVLEKIISRDKKKYQLCKEHNIPIIYIFNKRHSIARLDEQFNHMYDNALFIEDIEKNPQILLEKINEAKVN